MGYFSVSLKISFETLTNTFIDMNEETDDIIQYVEGSVFSLTIGSALSHYVSSDLKMGALTDLQFIGNRPDIRDDCEKKINHCSVSEDQY